MVPVEIVEGSGPVILAVPHSGTYLPADCRDRLNDTGKAIADTDWHVRRLYEGLLQGATFVSANFHRYVIDANRPPSGQSLYPGQNTTSLCPVTDFDGRPIYLDGMEPDDEEIARRKDQFHTPYHLAIESQVQRIRTMHGVAILYDCHSIRSKIPYLFEGKLPDFNIGTNSGASCSALISDAVFDRCRKAPEYSSVLNGRFKGGWTTRHYGRPETGVHAIQMELAQSSYMLEEEPWSYVDAKAERLREHLGDILSSIKRLAPALKCRTD